MGAEQPCIVKVRVVATGCNELSFVAYVSERVLVPAAMPPDPNLSTSPVLLYKDWKLPCRERHWEWLGDYQYVGMEPGGPSGYIGFAFSKVKTDEEKRTPWYTKTRFGDKAWDDVLLDIAVVKNGMKRSTLAAVGGRKTLLSGPDYEPRLVLVPGGARGTQFIVRKFISPTKFNIPAHDTSVPGLVYYEINGRMGSVVALHDDIFLRARTTVDSYVTGDTGGAAGGVVEGQFFPATNHTGWTNQFVYDDQDFTNGVWMRTQIEAIAPPMPEAVSQR